MTSQHKTNKFQASWHGICHEYANILHNLPKVISHHFLSRVVLSLGHAGLDSKASLPEIYLSIHVENTCFSAAKLCATLCNPMDCSKPGFPILHYFSDLSSIIFQGQAREEGTRELRTAWWFQRRNLCGYSDLLGPASTM